MSKSRAHFQPWLRRKRGNPPQARGRAATRPAAAPMPMPQTLATEATRVAQRLIISEASARAICDGDFAMAAELLGQARRLAPLPDNDCRVRYIDRESARVNARGEVSL